MDFTIPEEMQGMLGEMDEFVEKEIIPIEADFIAHNLKDLDRQILEKQEMVKKMGMWAPLYPKDVGGMGLKLVESALVYEVIARSPLGLLIFGCQFPDAGNVEVLYEFATPEQKEKWLYPVVEGKMRGCFAMTEVDLPGSNPVLMDTTAVKDGDDYVINGHKWFATAADGSEYAIVMVVTNPEALPHKQASMVIVPTGTPGYNLVRNIPMMGHAGKGYGTHSEIIFKDCRVPRKNLLGSEGEGFVLAQKRLGPGRIHHCMRWIAISKRALDMMCKRAVQRPMGKGEVLADKQIIQIWIAECAAEIEAAKMMVLNAAWKIQNHGVKEARKEIGFIKYYGADVLLKVIDRAIQTHGALGLTDDTILSYWYRHERAARVYDGPDEAHKAAVARSILKKFR